MKRNLLFAAVWATLLALAVAARAEEKDAIDPDSVDDVTLALSKLAVDTENDAISEKAYQAAKIAVLDALGCAMAGYQASGVPAVVDLTKEWGGREEATIWFHGGRVPGPAATFANSVQTHALDLDDFHSPSITHITSVIVPSAFAMGELHDASGRETLASIVLGIEVAGRLGRACRGLARPPGLPAHLRDRRVRRDRNRLPAAGMHRRPDRQRDGNLVRPLLGQPPGAVRPDADQADPAGHRRPGGRVRQLSGRKGLHTGPTRIIAGQPASLVPIYGLSRKGTPPTVGRVMEPHDFFEIELLAYKRYTSCGASHYALQAALDLANKHDLKPADVDKVWIFGCGVNSGMVGVPWDDSPTPQAMAQFCAPYEVASIIKNRRFGPAEITPQRIREDKEVDDLARRCELHHWNDWGGPKPAFQAVRIFLKDGRTLDAWHNQEEVLSPTSMTYEQLVAKFKYNVTFTGLVDEKRADEMVKAIENLDKCDNIGEFIKEYLVFEPRK